MNLTTEMTYTVPQATREAIDILEEEANQLAGLTHQAGSQAEYEKRYTHRTRIAIAREMMRLRAIAKALQP